MELQDLIIEECVHAGVDCQSKKRVLEFISESAHKHSQAGAKQIFNSLLSRERLGSTSIGHGVAIPHGRIPQGDKPFAVIVTLREPVSFDSQDEAGVDLIFALIIPEESSQEHLATLAEIAKKMTNKELYRQMRQTSDTQSLYHILRQL